MPISKDKIEKISLEVIKVLFTRFEKFPEDASSNRNAPFHTAFLNAFADKFEGKVSNLPFFISLSSWLHGLNTTLGQTFFENVAHILSDGEKRQYTSKKLGNLPITKQQKENINDLITALSTSQASPNPENENQKLFINENTEIVSAIDFSADVFIEDTAHITAIELKTVRPNSGEMRGEKQKILEGKAALFKKFTGKTIKFFIGFPFDPTNEESETGYDKTRFLGSNINMNKFFAPDETLIAGELWDFLSGESATMDILLKIINTVATTEFPDKYSFLNNQENKRQGIELYKQRLADWNLYSELNLVNNETTIKEKIGADKKLNRTFNQMIFKDGDYNIGRHDRLSSFL
ncbi:MAG: TdeIII family type II restriction endonuclease [Nitrospirota bacterium]